MDVNKVAVIGLGTMGHGIAQTFAIGGCEVRCFDESSVARATLIPRIQQNLRSFAAAGMLDSADLDAILNRIQLCETESEAVEPVEFVTEAIAEDLAQKQELLQRLENIVGVETILASNSSAFPISKSGDRLRFPARAIVTHWFNPPHLVPLVEVVPSPRTHERTIERTMAILRHIGKRPLRLRKELPGFLVNRVQVAIQREVWDLLDQGVASAEEIDTALRDSVGFRMAAVGPLEVHDFGGLDIQAATFCNLAPEIRGGSQLPGRVRELVAQGALGTKTGRGFFEYPAGRLEERRERRDRLFLELARLLGGGNVD